MYVSELGKICIHFAAQILQGRENPPVSDYTNSGLSLNVFQCLSHCNYIQINALSFMKLIIPRHSYLYRALMISECCLYIRPKIGFDRTACNLRESWCSLDIDRMP